MDKMYLLLILGFFQVFVVADVAASPLNSKEFTCPGDGFYAIPGQCSSSYYACVEGVAYDQTCPGLTLFDPLTLQCTSPDTVSCRDTTTLAPFTCAEDGNYALPGQCSPNYYICVDGTAYPATCPGSTIFDPLTLQCASPDTVSCRNGTTTVTTPTTTTAPTTTPGTFTCPPTDGNYPIPGQCTSSYYICIGGTAYPANCPNGNIFDPELFRCVAPDLATCNNNSTTTRTTPTSTTPSGPFSCPAQDGNFPIPGTCGSDYFICIGGTAYPGTCPGGAVFDPQTFTCVNPSDASCTVPTTSPSGGSTTAEYPFTCPRPDGTFANPSDCNTYYVCSNNRPFLQACPPGTVFNPVILQCDFPFNVPGCQDSELKTKKRSWFHWF